MISQIYNEYIQAGNPRQLGQNPGVMAWQTIEMAREQLTVLLQELKSAMHVAGVVEINSATTLKHEPLTMWDEIMYEPVPAGPNPLTVVQEEPGLDSPVLIKNQFIPLPSNGNVSPTYTQLEISHHIPHADYHLNRI